MSKLMMTGLVKMIVFFQSTWVRASSPPTSLEQAPHIGRKSGSKDFTVPDYFAKSYLDNAGSTCCLGFKGREHMVSHLGKSAGDVRWRQLHWPYPGCREPWCQVWVGGQGQGTPAVLLSPLGGSQPTGSQLSNAISVKITFHLPISPQNQYWWNCWC